MKNGRGQWKSMMSKLHPHQAHPHLWDFSGGYNLGRWSGPSGLCCKSWTRRSWQFGLEKCKPSGRSDNQDLLQSDWSFCLVSSGIRCSLGRPDQVLGCCRNTVQSEQLGRIAWLCIVCGRWSHSGCTDIISRLGCFIHPSGFWSYLYKDYSSVIHIFPMEAWPPPLEIYAILSLYAQADVTMRGRVNPK